MTERLGSTAGPGGWWPIAMAALLLAAACAHARQVGSAGEGESAPSTAEHERGAAAGATRKRVPPRGDRPAVAASPEGLMNPGSARKIQEALRAHGLLREAPTGRLDEPTSAALRRFQRDHDLAETGAPDRETLRRLGIDPSDVYRSAPGSS